MGARGPKPGAKRAAAEVAAVSERPGDRPVVYADLTTSQKNNPRFLVGEQLAKLAHQNGMSKTEIARIGDDAKIRSQLELMIRRRHDEEAEQVTA